MPQRQQEVEFEIVPFDDDYQAWVRELLTGAWGSSRIVSRGVLYNVLDYPGYVAVMHGQPQGLVTYRLDDDACEVLALYSTLPGEGIATALVARVKDVAREAGCTRLWLITTNDNTHALRWYQRNGFQIAAVHVNALEASRKLKPEIPLLGHDGIPIRDEIELEMVVAAKDQDPTLPHAFGT